MNRKIDGLGRVVLPKEIRTQLGIQTNDMLNIELKGNKIIITKDFDAFDNYLSTLISDCENTQLGRFLSDVRDEYRKGR